MSFFIGRQFMRSEIIKSFLKVIGTIMTLIFAYIQIAAPAPSAQSLLPSFLHIFIPAKWSESENKLLPQTTIDLNSQIVTECYTKKQIDSNNDSFENRVRHGQDRMTF